jgi:hypothetical protein
VQRGKGVRRVRKVRIQMEEERREKKSPESRRRMGLVFLHYVGIAHLSP